MVKAVFPGSFDPPTFGHLNIIERGSRLFDSLDVVIAVNSSKTPLMPPEEKKRLLELEIGKLGLSTVRVAAYEGLVVEYCQTIQAQVLLRGVRSMSDFDYEFELSVLNRHLDSGIETVFLPTEPKFFVLRSSTIKELMRLGGDISAMVPSSVAVSLHNLDL
ncbi:MAG: pantetheine-phosphate adenylyltransferase [Spirochaetaceae bacterium]|nr:pantetheine-phosphate adenylyltransferase [Spirochaetaceae bacterium]MDT8298615.1 pantetheine-phosphate adenylyltransferase [Spirochaetaceae bacterium]